MFKNRFCGMVVSLVCFVVSGPALSQLPGSPEIQGERLEGTVAIDRALKSSTLTSDGRSFHALMEVGTRTPYTGQIELWWVSATKYHLVVTSPDFSQARTVNADQVEEKNLGNYYPRWLENFVLALIDPLPMAQNFRGGSVRVGPEITRSCLERNDRPGGITDETTWGQVCFSGKEPRLSDTQTFNISMERSDWKSFDKKQIPRTYQTYVLGFEPVVGRLTKLEELKQPNESMFKVAANTPDDQRISTAFVSTLKEESLIESAPQIQWPPVREGKTEGYMIVYARTDRTGQVRETHKHNSDQPGLESFGMEQALRYKFKPLIVDGVAKQMEMPLVLHFTSRVADPLPILSVADMKKQMGSCEVGTLPPGTPKGLVVIVRVSIDDAGRLTGMGPVGDVKGGDWIQAMSKLRTCQFAPYFMNGKATYYKGDLQLLAP